VKQRSPIQYYLLLASGSARVGSFWAGALGFSSVRRSFRAISEMDPPTRRPASFDQIKLQRKLAMSSSNVQIERRRLEGYLIRVDTNKIKTTQTSLTKNHTSVTR
jgi:hypothetical protein